MRNKNKSTGLLKQIARLFWPEVCPFCGRVNTSGPCRGCIFTLKKLRTKSPVCFCCGKPIRSFQEEYCMDCRRTKHFFDQGRSLWIHKGPVKEAIYRFKYHNLRSAGWYFAVALTDRYKRLLKEWQPDLIIPIPLHRRRRRSRGYNQALLLAGFLGEILEIPVDGKSLSRKYYTSPQKKLDHGKRRENLRQAFALSTSFQPVKSVLLVDDIYTTGNTMDAAAGLLKEAGVEKIYFFTVSVGFGES